MFEEEINVTELLLQIAIVPDGDTVGVLIGKPVTTNGCETAVQPLALVTVTL